jgi:membrane protein DedA with SNARE-associated domain
MMSAMTFFDAALVQALIAHYGYAAVFAVAMLESSGLPLPGETILVCAGVYAGTQRGLDIRLIIAARAAAHTGGGRAVVKINPGAYDRTASISRVLPAM